MGEIKKQSISNTVLSYVGAVIGFLSLIYIQPYFLGSEKMGLLKLVYNFSWLVAMAMPLGMGNVTLRFFPKFKNPSTTHHGYFSLLFLMVLLGALIVFITFYFLKDAFSNYYSSSPKFIHYYYFCFAFAFVVALISVYNIYASSLLKTAFSVFLTDIYLKLAFIAIVFIYYFGWISEFGLVISYIVIHVIQLLLLLLYLIYLKAVSFKIDWHFFRGLDRKIIITFAIIMMFTSFASLGIKYIDSLVLGHFLDLKVIGVYSVCAFIPTILEIPFNSLERIAMPKVAHAWHIHDMKEINKIYEMSSRYLFFIGSVLFCFLLAGDDFIFNTLPPEYKLGHDVFIIISACSLFNLVTGVNNTVLSLSSKYYINSIFLIVLIVVGIAANMYLIPIYGINGAAWATLIAIGMFNLLKYLYILFKFEMQPFTRHTFYILLSLILSILMILIIPSSWNAFLKACTGCTISGIIFLLFNIKFEIVTEVNQILRKFKLIK